MTAGTENRKKRLAKDLGIYAIGNLGSKLITFFMVPLYTFFVHDVSEFGYYDICLSAVMFCLPIVSLQIPQGAYRYLVGAEGDVERQVLVQQQTYKALAKMLALALAITGVATAFFDIKYVWHSFALMCSMTLYELVSQVVRGLGNTKAFVTAGIISSFGVGLFSVLFVVVMDGGVAGIFFANILARLVAAAYMEMRMHIVKRCLQLRNRFTSEQRRQMLKEVLSFSAPMVLVGTYWWLTNFSDRFFIAHFVGLESNGIYSVAVRFTAILQTFGSIFYQAWQDSAFRQYNSPDRNKFFSDVLNVYVVALVIILLFYTFGLKLAYPWLVADAYQDSVQYVYLLGVSATLYTMVQYTNTIYQCALDTKRTVPQMLVLSVVNLALNFLFIVWLGIYGVIIASIVTFSLMLVYRAFDMRRYLKLKMCVSALATIAMAAVGVLPFYCLSGVWHNVAFLLGAVAVILLLQPKQYREMLLSKLHKHQG